jgi:hypothetical protein
MCKWQRAIPRHKGSPRYRIAHGWKMSMDLLILKPWNSLCILENRGVHFILFLHHTYIFFLFFSFFFILTFFFFFLSFFHSFIFYLLPLNSKLLVLEQRCDRDKVGTGNTFPLERYLKSSMLAPSCDLPWIDDPFLTIGCGQGGNHKRWYLVLRMDTRRGLWNLRCGDTQCTDKKASNKIDTQKRND